MPEPSKQDRKLARLVGHSGLMQCERGAWDELQEQVVQLLAQVREEGRRHGLQLAREACADGIASEEAKAQGFVSWSAELCISAIKALEAQDG